MEGTPLFDKLNRLMRPSPLESLTEGTEEIRVILHNSEAPEEVSVKGLARFHTIEDLQRALWVQQGKQEDLFPKYTFLAFEDEDGVQNATGTWMEESTDKPLILPEPNQTIRGSILQDQFVDTDGNKKPMRFSARGRVTLGDAFLVSAEELPVFHCYTLQYLLRQYKGTVGAMPARDWYGLFYPYFPALAYQTDFSVSAEDTKFAESVETYISAKLSQVALLSELLGLVSLRELKTVGTKYLSLLWTDASTFDGADILFYTASVDENRPYMRLLTPNTTPITKLYQPDSTGLPQVHDVALLKTWSEDTSPLADKSVLYIKALVRKEQVGTPPLYGTYIISDDGTANFILQPPKEIRQLDVQHDLGQLGKLLYDTSLDLPIHLQDAKLYRAQLTIHLEYEEVPPKDIRRQAAERFEQLGTLFQPASVPKGMQKPLFMFRFKGVSNFIQEDKIMAYLTFFFSRKGLPTDDAMQFYAEHLADEFELSVDEAIGYIKTYLTKRAEMAIADPDAKEFLPVENAGIEIAITSENVTTFNIQLLNVDSFESIQLICTILSLVFYGTKEEWDDVLQTHKLVAPTKVAKAEEEVSAESLHEEAKEREGTIPLAAQQADIFFDEFEGFGDEEEQVAAVANIPKAPVPVAVAPAAAPVKKGKEALRVKEEGEQAIIPYEWYITRLKKLDNRLFEYKVTTGTRHWTSQCATNDDRQPAILTQSQYLNMRSIYADDEAEDKIGFIVYGVPNTAETIQEAKGKHLQITVLRYGSDASAPNYYLCTEYFCLRDLLPLIPEEFKGTTDRNGDPKPANSCPFCGGTLFGDSPNERKHPLPGQTVHRRRVKQQSSKKHLYINFLKNPAHPLGFDMPCCFVSRKDIGWADERFRRLRDVSPKTSAAAVAQAEAEHEEEEKASVRNSLYIRTQQLVSYDQLRYRIHREYVVGPEKFPLEPGKIGMPNLALDAYLGQDSASMVVRSAVRQEFKPDVHGFFRLGVLNRTTLNNQSLFAALAPCLGMNTISEVEGYFLNLIKVNLRLFLHLNFGNLLLDFFDPEYEVTADEETEFKLISTQINFEGSELELDRLKRSYSNFKKYITDPSQKKQLKYFAHLLAEIGLTILTITYKGNPRDPATEVDVSCPLLGLDMDRFNTNKVAFLTYHPPSGIWEPLMYIDQIIEKDTAPIHQEAFYSISQEQFQADDFPRIVLQRYKEFRTQCRAAFRGAFTLQRGIDSRELIPLTQMITLVKPLKIEGIVRDSSNHLVAITVRPIVSNIEQEILIPVADDGNPLINVSDVRLHLGLQSIEFAVPEDVEEVYRLLSPKLQPLSKLYTLNGFLTTDQVVGFRLGVPGVTQMINLPCFPYEADNLKTELVPLEQNDWFKFEYELNRAISFDDFPKGEGETKPVEAYTETPYLLGRELADNIYQHLRLSFSNWIALTEQRSTVRQFVDRLLYREKTIPIYEKMRRLEIELGPTIQQWFAADSQETFAVEPIVFRADCLTQPEDKCDGYCAVKDGECKIHTPDKVTIGYNKDRSVRRVEAVRYFMLRLFDEILRLPAKRAELLNKGVRRIQVPSRNVHIGTEWILPETSAAWYTLLRDSKDKAWEKPTRYEEFSRQTESEEEKKARLAVIDVQELPAELDAYITPEGKSKLGLRIVGKEDDARVDKLLEQFALKRAAVDTSTDVFGAATLSTLADKVKVPVVQVLIKQPDIPALARKPTNAEAKPGVVILIPDATEGPGMLIDTETTQFVIPTEWTLPKLLEGAIYEAIKPKLLRPAAAAKPKPNAAAARPATVKPRVLEQKQKAILQQRAAQPPLTAHEPPVAVE